MVAKSLFTLFLLLDTMRSHAENHLPVAPVIFCLACDVPSSLQVIAVSCDSATLSWNAVAGAGQCTLKVEERQQTANKTSAVVDMTMRLFPNPSSVEATLTFEAAHNGEATIQVFDMAGLMIWNQAVQAVSGNTNILQLTSVHFHNGCYLVQVRAGAQTQLLKWVEAK